MHNRGRLHNAHTEEIQYYINYIYIKLAKICYCVFPISWYFTHMCTTLDWPHHFTNRWVFEAIKLVLYTSLLFKCLCQVRKVNGHACIWLLGVLILPLSTICRLVYGNVRIVCIFFVFHSITIKYIIFGTPWYCMHYELGTICFLNCFGNLTFTTALNYCRKNILIYFVS